MSRRRVLLSFVAIALLLVSCEYQDSLQARLFGMPVALVATTDSIKGGPRTLVPLEPFTHAFIKDGRLHLLIRTWFHHRSEFSEPYLVVDSKKNGVLHVNVKRSFSLVGHKCEFLRQFEVAISASQWASLNTLRLFNHDIGQEGGAMAIADASYMNGLLAQSKKDIALESLEGTSSGC
ncbi:MAG: hypothetical protein V4805_09025 [Pseudomonadota bacterium]